MSNPSEEDDEGDISSVMLDSTSTSYGDMMMLERVLSLHGRQDGVGSGEDARHFRVAYAVFEREAGEHKSYHSIIASLTHIKRYERLQKVYEKRLVSLERALEQCVHVTKTDSIVKQMKLDDASSKYASERVIEMFRNALDGTSDTYAHLAQYIIPIVVRIADTTIQTVLQHHRRERETDTSVSKSNCSS